MMVIVSKRFIFNRVQDTADLLAQDGLTGWKWRAKIWSYLLVRPGFLRRIAPQWLAFFMPGFHPWNHDDRSLIAKHEGDFADALLPA
jgi:predicted metal-dependent hydrolase